MKTSIRNDAPREGGRPHPLECFGVSGRPRPSGCRCRPARATSPTQGTIYMPVRRADRRNPSGVRPTERFGSTLCGLILPAYTAQIAGSTWHAVREKLGRAAHISARTASLSNAALASSRIAPRQPARGPQSDLGGRSYEDTSRPDTGGVSMGTRTYGTAGLDVPR